MFISPSEPKQLRELGVQSLIPEEYGVDVLWNSEMGIVGVQRKVFPGDFLASVYDNRLRREYGQMRQLDLAVLLLEGKGRWTVDGELVDDHGERRWSKSQHQNYLTSVQLQGIVVQESDGIPGTIQFLRNLQVWSDKGSHDSLERRNKNSGPWGLRTNRNWQEYFLQGLPGVGPVQARNILDTLGTLPVELTATDEELLSVPGIGKGRVKKIRKVFEG
jgi:ERCC4-type nuclease